MNLWALFHALIGSYFHRERGRTILTGLGLSLGVAVLVAVDLANEAAVASFKETVSDVAGSAEVTLRGNGAGLPGETVGKLAGYEEAASVSPLISGNVFFPAADGRTTETLLLLGADLLRSEEEGGNIRDFTFDVAEEYEFADFLINPGLIVLTEEFMRRRALTLGDQFELLAGGRMRPFKVAASIGDNDFFDSLNGKAAVVDIAVADEVLRRQGLLDRVDIILSENVDSTAFINRLQEEFSGSVIVERPEQRGSQVEEMIAAFRFNLRALGHIAILVGAFIIYNTMSIAVVRRRSAIGTVRAMGVSRGMVRAVFLLEGLMLGLAGSVIGAAAGFLMAQAMVGQVSDAISINFFQTNASQVPISWEIILGALVLGTLGSVAAALAPANEAASTPPANTMRRGSESSSASPWIFAIAGAPFFLLGFYLLSVEGAGQLPLIGYGASLMFIAGFVAWSRPLMTLMSAAARAPYAKFFRGEGILAVSGVQAAPGRAAVAICGLMISLGMAISVSIMIESFRSTVVTWMEQVLVADVFVRPASPDGARRPAPIHADLANDIAMIEGVRKVDPFRTREIEINGRKASLGAGRISTVEFQNSTLDGRPAAEAMKTAAAKDHVMITEAFARKHGYQRGDLLPVPTPQGIVEIPIEGVYYDYSSEQGYAVMDRALYLRYFDDPMADSIAVYLTAETDPGKTAVQIERLAQSRGDTPALTIRTNRDLRTFALEAFDRTFAITYVIQVIAILVSILGVATTLLAQLLDRRHEIVTLRYIGADQKRILKVIVLETSLIGLLGCILGTISGVTLSYILTKNIMLQSFGWTIDYHIPWLLIAQIAAVVFASTLLAAIIPAREASKFSNRSVQTMAG